MKAPTSQATPTAALALLLALGAAAAPARAVLSDDQDNQARGAEKRLVVRIDETEGHPRVVFVDEDGAHLVEPWSARRGYLGVGLLDLTPELRLHFGASRRAGVLVSQIANDGPAQGAGLEVGDVLVAIDGEPVRSASGAAREIGRREDGETVELELVREREPLTLSARLAEKERSQLDLGRFFWRCPEGEDCADEHFGSSRRVLPIDPDHLNHAMKELNEHLASPEWRERILRFKGGYEGLEERLHELEERLHELEEQLADERDGR